MRQKEQINDFFCDNWKNVIEKIQDGFMLVDLKGNILYANPALEKILQFSKGELLGQPCEILECDSYLNHTTNREQTKSAFFKNQDTSNRRCSFRQKNGSIITVLRNATVLTDQNGKIVGGIETITDLTTAIENEVVIAGLRKELNRENSFHGLIGNSSSMQQVYDLIKSAAQSNAPIIINGESGTGKGLVANAIHTLSKHSDHPFTKIHCAMLNENNLENELFGSSKGSFSGTKGEKYSRFEAAGYGSVFLDEIGDLPIVIQKKLSKFLMEEKIERTGNFDSPPMNIRIISATNKNLYTLMDEKKFRKNLFLKIGATTINIPPLRNHPEDIPLLIKSFIDKFNLGNTLKKTTIRKDALDSMIKYNWPGNIRELINVIEYAFILCPDGEITPKHLPHQFEKTSSNTTGQKKQQAPSPHDKRQQLLNVLTKTKGNKSKAAKILGISRVTLWKRLKKYKITVDKSVY